MYEIINVANLLKMGEKWWEEVEEILFHLYDKFFSPLFENVFFFLFL